VFVQEPSDVYLFGYLILWSLCRKVIFTSNFILRVSEFVVGVVWCGMWGVGGVSVSVSVV
jgi:hypothetical protein